jgi:bifunctional DNase/RNase
MTHDLMINLLTSLGASLERVVVTEVIDATYFAELHLQSSTGPSTLSARPSDAIAIALRAEAPIFVAQSLMDEVGVVLVEADEDEEDADDLVDEFRAFLDSIDPDDFQAS